MNWFRENKLLAVFLGFVVVGSAALIYFLLQAVGHFNEVDDDYKTQVAQLNRLQTMVPYPNQQNLNKYKEQKTTLSAAITNLQQQLSKLQFPLEPMTPETFQDKLRTSVNAVSVRAGEVKANLPKEFALGFDRYLTETPNKEAAAALGRQLKSIEFIVNELLDSKVDAITAIARAPLPEESGQKQPKSLVTKYPFEISIVADQGRFRKMLNDIVSTTKQFYIVRLIQIKNQKDKSPSKASANPSAAATPAKEGNSRLSFIFGTEKLNVVLRFEMVDFGASPEK